MRSLLLLPLITTAAAAQQVKTRTLAKPESEYTEPFSSLSALIELKDGRVVAADLRDKTLQAIDLRSGRATPIGREGAGPQEWNTITALFGWRGDSIVANDFGNGRYLVIGPDAKPVRTFITEGDGPVVLGGPADAARGSAGRGAGAGSAGGGAGGRGGDGGRVGGGRVVEGPPGGRGGLGGGLSLGIASASDARGRLYSQGMAITFDKDHNLVPGDSAPILRLDPATQKVDTVAFVNLAKDAASGSARGDGRGGQTVEIRMGSTAAYPAADDWTVFRDGTVAILRVADYHVEYVRPNGRRVVGRPIPYTPVRVGEAEKQEWREALKSATPIVRTIGDGARGGPIPRPNLAQEPSSWPATKPPFLAGRRSPAAIAAPNGDLWVVRTRAANDRIPTIDVFNAEAQLIGQIVLPERTRLVGLGAKGVYTARVDEDDLQYLQRHALQWTGCAPEVKEICGR